MILRGTCHGATCYHVKNKPHQRPQKNSAVAAIADRTAYRPTDLRRKV